MNVVEETCNKRRQRRKSLVLIWKIVARKIFFFCHDILLICFASCILTSFTLKQQDITDEYYSEKEKKFRSFNKNVENNQQSQCFINLCILFRKMY